jgi:hypothetical protein
MLELRHELEGRKIPLHMWLEILPSMIHGGFSIKTRSYRAAKVPLINLLNPTIYHAIEHHVI